jgi:ABC-type transport system involved in cytochrome c biogenesis permease subunit
MAAIDVTSKSDDFVRRPRTSRDEQTVADDLLRVLTPLASLKITVTIFALGIFLIFVGTLAQVDQDIWQVTAKYFRAALVWVPFQVFFPASFFPSKPIVPGSFPFPGGFTLLTAAFINLTAAHALRFKVQATGTRMAAGLAVTALGIAIAVLVVLGGSNKNGELEVAWIEWPTLWNVFLGMLAAATAGAVWSMLKLERSRKIERASLLVVAIVLGTLLTGLLVQGDAARLSDSAMRILWQLMKGSVAALVMLAGCILLFRKRAGVVLLHAGVGLMMINELVVYELHVETRMSIEEGQTVNWVQDTRTLELAIVDPSNPETDSVTVIPEWMVLDAAEHPGKRIHDARLPFDIEIVKFIPNSNLTSLAKGEKSEATDGDGARLAVQTLRPGTGTDSDASVDMASAYVRLYERDKDKPLGTWLLSQMFSLLDIPQQVTVDGKQLDLFLRFQRHYKPYAVKLEDVKQDTYLGTRTARNYASDVRVVDPQHGVDREVKIWMNNPLRFEGETFYQSGYHMDPRTGKESTTLQVVTNTGWMIPYVAVTIVAIGMLAHFMVTLSRFLTRRNEAATGVRRSPSKKVIAEVRSQNAGWTDWVVPVAVGVAALALGLIGARTPKSEPGKMDLYAFGALPLAYEGRVKPYDTLARTSLRAISGRETFRETPKDENPNKSLYELFTKKGPPSHSAIEWLLDVIADPAKAAEYRIFRVENFDVLNTLGVDQRQYFRYAIGEFQKNARRFSTEVDKADAVRKANKQELDVYQKKLLEFNGKLNVYLAIDAAFHPQAVPDFATEEEAQADPEAARKRFLDSMKDVQQSMRALAAREVPLAVPEDGKAAPWVPYSNAVVEAYLHRTVGHEVNEPVRLLATIFHAYAERNDHNPKVAAKAVATFNEGIAKYRDYLNAHPPKYSDVEKSSYERGFEWMLTHVFGFTNSPFLKTDFEAAFNHWNPFDVAWYMYTFAFVLTALSWLVWPKLLSRSAIALVLAAFAIHTIALAARIYISGRPPVTNLYSSAVFIGWGAVLLGLVFERINRLGIGALVAEVAGFSTLQIAHMLSVINGGDTFVVLQAVLDTQFWLATHVTCITLGYATTYVAGLLGLIYVIRGVFTPSLSSGVGKELSRMIYGTLCFAIFFSAVGTILGGLWADDSWGRFWGWDPKENGALIIVMWNALVLHSRWGAIVGDRGMAVLAIGGNIVTSWSWFGVNELGIGLHSYGFTDGVLLALGVFCLSQLAVIGLGLLPKDRWKSTQALATA